jgi:hypothetical protein
MTGDAGVFYSSLFKYQYQGVGLRSCPFLLPASPVLPSRFGKYSTPGWLETFLLRSGYIRPAELPGLCLPSRSIDRKTLFQTTLFSV